MREGVASYAQHSTLIENILELKDRFQECNFMYVGCVGNGVAHQLAQHAWHDGNLHVWGGRNFLTLFSHKYGWMLDVTKFEINEAFTFKKIKNI